MGVIFCCDEYDYPCSYSSWSIVRMEFFYATIRFLEAKLNELENNDYGSVFDIISNKSIITDVDKFLDFFDNRPETIKMLFTLEIYGLYVLLDKPDDTGFYSPGNSFDILCLIKKIKSYIEDKTVKERLRGIKKLFNTSVKKKKLILII